MNRIKSATVAMLLASFVGFQPAPVLAHGRSQRDRYEDQRDRQEAKRERREHREARREEGRRAEARRMDRSDRIYRGSDNRYYCKRDDGTTGLIIGGVAGGVLGNIIAPGGSKILGSIIGAGAGALIGRAIDDGDMVCR